MRAISAQSPAERRTRERFRGEELNAVQYPNGWVIYHLPFAPENVGARKIGFGNTEEEAWEEASNATL